MKPARSIAQAHPFGRALALVGAALLAVVLIGSPAMAQIGAVGDTVKDVGGTVGDTTGSVGGTVGDTTGSVGDTVKDTGGTVGDTTGSVGGTVGDTVKDTGGKVGGTVGGSVGGTIKDTTDKVGDTIKDTSGTVGNTVTDTSAEVGKSIDGATEGVLGEGTRGDKNHGTKKDGFNGGKNKKNRQEKGTKVTAGNIEFGEGAFGFGTRVPAISLNGLEGAREIAGGQVAAFTTPDPLDLGALTEAAVEAAKKFAFPIMLSILVACFMLIQDRVDRKDPKLALAAVDTDQDWLSFA